MRQWTPLTTTTTLTNADHYFRQSFQQLQHSPVHILESSPSVPGEVGEGDSVQCTLLPPVVVWAQPVVPSPLDVQGGDVVALKGGLFKQVVSHLRKTTDDMYKVDVVAIKEGLFKQVASHFCRTTADVWTVAAVALIRRQVIFVKQRLMECVLVFVTFIHSVKIISVKHWLTNVSLSSGSNQRGLLQGGDQSFMQNNYWTNCVRS